MGIGNHERPNKGTTDIWLTPLDLVAKFGEFDLDPCGQAEHWTADVIYTDKGLDLKWFGRVWLNPPYSEVGRWLDRMVAHKKGIALVFARMETRWAQRILPQADSVFFPAKRITFLKADGSLPRGSAGAPSMFLSFGEKPNWHDIMPGWIAK